MTSSESKHGFFKKGMENLENNQIDEAIANFSEAIILDPQHADAYLFRGFAYELIHYDCLTEYEIALNLNPEIPLTYPKKREELLQKLQGNRISEIRKFNDTYFTFSLNENQCHRFEQWYNALFRTFEGVSGGALTFSFTPTSLGTTTKVTYERFPIFYKLGMQKESIDLTEYEDW